VTRWTCDILRFEQRGSDFALVRMQADGSRSEMVLTPANVVHLGLIAPDFSRRLLAGRLGKKPDALAGSVKNAVVRSSVRTIEVVLALFERSGGQPGSLMTEQRARALALRLLEKADQLAKARGPVGT
jgi:hypothetical protein